MGITQSELTAQQVIELDRMNPTADRTSIGTRLKDLESVARASDAKASVRVASTANITTFLYDTPMVVDGVVVAAGDRVLVKNQSTGAENGPYDVDSIASKWLLFDAQTGAFAVGLVLTGGTSGHVGTIAEVIDNGTTGALRITGATGIFQDNETITDSGTGSADANGTTGDWLIPYDTQTGNFAVAETVTASGGNVGDVTGDQDDGTTGLLLMTRTTGRLPPADNETLAGDGTGVAVVNGSAYNGATGGWSRSSDIITAGAEFTVTEGTASGDTSWFLTTNDDIVVGTTSLTFAQSAISAAEMAGGDVALFLNDGVALTAGTGADATVSFVPARSAVVLGRAGVQMSGFNGLSDRYEDKWVAGQRGKPGLNADIQNSAEAVRMIADPFFEILGANATSGSTSYNSDGGIDLTTAGADGDEVILLPHLDANQSPWTGIACSTDVEQIWECKMRLGSNITNYIAWAGLKLTNTEVKATDDDQVYFRYEDDVASGNWEVVNSIGGTDVSTDTGVAAAVDQAVYLMLVFAADRTVKCYLNGALVHTTAALTDGVTVIPYIGVAADGAAAAKVLTVYGQARSRIAG